MNRQDLQSLAELRLREAEALHAQDLESGAYYLCGYAVECALKACIAKKTQEFEFPSKRVAIESHTHDLVQLVRTAGLQPALERRIAESRRFEANWTTVKDWSEAARYSQFDVFDSVAMLVAVRDPVDGVLPWLRQIW